MPFIGNQPALSYTSFAKQDFTTSATTSYTLDNPVANANELALFINFVRQEPGSYSASGTQLTLTEATSSSDDMYCVYLGKAVQTVNPPNASVGLSQLTATGTKDATTFLRGDNTFAVAGGTNTPNFSANRITTFSFSVNTWTKLILNNELYDTASAYDTTNARFTVPSGQAGKYHFSAHFFSYESTANNNIGSYNIGIYKNGSLELWLAQNEGASLGSYRMNIISGDLNLTVGDYIELYGRVNTTGTAEINVSSSANRFSGFKIIE